MIQMDVFAYMVYHFIKSYIIKIKPSNHHIILSVIFILHAWCALEKGLVLKCPECNKFD